jgi:N-acetylmuramoyl-L-alanine amidase
VGQLVVVIDPGHGGADVGAVGIGGIREADIVLPISHQVAALLQQQGVYVVMTRSDDREVELEPRVQLAERANATLFVSIHANSISMDRPDVNGVETYYYSSGQGLAQVIQNSIVNSLGMNDRGARQARFYVLRRTSMPAVLVEVGFVTGSDDAPRLADTNFQGQMARAIAQGILVYIQQQALVRE